MSSMPTKNNSSSNRRQAKKARKEKRKANSPLSGEDTHNETGLASTGTTSTSKSSPPSVQANVNNRHSEYFDFRLSQDNVNQVMSQQNQSPLPMSFAQPNFGHPQFYMSTPTSPTQSQHIQNTPPPWALGIMDDIRTIRSSSQNIEKTLNIISVKVSELEVKLTCIDKRVTSVENSCAFISTEFESQKAHISNIQKEITSLETQRTKMERQLEDYSTREEYINDKLSDLESRSMQENLMFYGFDESKEEDCEVIVKTFIKDILQIEAHDIKLDRVHRIGPYSNSKTRPIVAKFHDYNDRERVRKQAYVDAIKTELSRRKMGVGIQRPQLYREARQALFPHSKEAEAQHERVRIVGNKMFVNNVARKKFVNGRVVDIN
ncbi:hypothetical protein DPMN_180267 [Dreissena polymorpha]|uniref:Uncharacterized protein n=1 Tax=Dreissena polymorpha TaxID=45954 RepID=A0A9D4EHU0_DREPO|nr:hypothetical protein DPMN_180267 [Dreissena polymorpha]